VGAVHLAAYGPEARRTLATVLTEAKRADPLAPVTVAVPSNYAGLLLRRLLASEGAAERPGGGLLNVGFMVFARVAELLGAPRLAPLRRGPLVPPLRYEAIRAALETDRGPFNSIAPEAADAVERSLDATFRDLDHTDDAGLEAIASAGKRAAHIVATYRRFRTATADRYDDRDLYAAAADAVREDAAALRDVGHVLLFLSSPPTPAESLLLDALAERDALDVVVGLTGDPLVDEPALARWTSALGEPLSGPASAERTSAGSAPAGKPPSGTLIVSVPDQEEEVREAVREIAERAGSGTPLHRMALLYRHADPYAQIAAEQLRAAGIPWNGPSTVSLGQTLAGRTLLGFLALAPEGFRREAVADWLNSAPILATPRGAEAPSHRWEVLARTARVIRGADQWRRRLRQRDSEIAIELRRAETDTTIEEWRVARLESERRELERLTAFVEELVDATAPPPANTWQAHAHRASVVLERYLGGERRSERWPDEELAAYRQVREIVEELAGLDALGLEVDAPTFRRAVERSLDRRAGRVGRFGSGVFLGRLADAVGTDFDAVFVLGMNEGSIPVAGREDPLLPDVERARAGDAVPLHAQRAAHERRDYLAALATAPERVLLVPRADLRGQQARMPSRWAVEAASALEQARSGERVFASTLDDEHYSDAPWYRSVRSFEAALAGGAEPASTQEYDLRSLLRRRRAGDRVDSHYLAAMERALGAGFEAQWARRSAALTEWAGLVPAAGSKSPLSPEARPVSPTRLQGLATCPFRFFLDSVLGIAEFDEPEEELSISPLAKGSLVHEILDRFIGRAGPRQSWDEAWTPGERALLKEIAAEACANAEEAGITGRALLWKHERARIIRDLDHFLDEDEKLRRLHRTTTVDTELAFGLEGRAPVEVTLDDGRTIRVRGYIDRVDRSDDGRLLVIDYKTGGLWGYGKMDEDPLDRGRLLQLPVYAAAARASEHGNPDAPVYALYWFITGKGNWQTPGYDVDETIEGGFRETLRVLGETVERGVFPARSGKWGNGDFENCRYCAYTKLCPPDRQHAWRRVIGDPVLAEYLKLAEPDAASEENGAS